MLFDGASVYFLVVIFYLISQPVLAFFIFVVVSFILHQFRFRENGPLAKDKKVSSEAGSEMFISALLAILLILCASFALFVLCFLFDMLMFFL